MVYELPKKYEVVKIDLENGKKSLATTSASLDDILNSAHIEAYREVGETTWTEIKDKEIKLLGED